MSKLYKRYVCLKNEDSDKRYLFKYGIFYVFLDEDARHMSNIAGFKLSYLTDNIVKCGFPVNSLEKYINMFKIKEIDVKVVDNEYTSDMSIISYAKHIVRDEILDKILKLDMLELSPREAHNTLCDIKKNLEKNKEVKRHG